MKSVYLAGPISGLSFGECTDWRNAAIKQLAEAGIEGLSPMRAKEYLAGLGEPLGPDGDKYKILSPLSTNRGIMTRDRWDATRCDVLFANLLDAKTVSVGTVMEIAWADLKRTPIVAVMEEGNKHDHGMIFEAIGFKVKTVQEGLNIVKAILHAG